MLLAGSLWTATAATAQHWVKYSNTHQWTPSVTFNPHLGEWWASYVDHDNNPSWCKPDNSCSANTKSRAYNAWGTYLRERTLANTLYIPDKDPFLAYNPDKRQFLAVWYDNARGSVWNGSCDLRADIKGRILDQWGNAVSGVLNIASDYHYDQAFPRAAYNPVSKKYMVVWQELNTNHLCAVGFGALNDGPWRVRGKILNDSGSNYTGNLSLANQDSNQERPDVVAHPSQDKFMVVWQDRRHGTAHIFGQMFNRYGNKYFPSYELIVGLSSNGSKNSRNPKVTYNIHDDHFVAAWTSAESGYNSDGYVYANRMRGSDAAWIGSPVKVSSGVSNSKDNEWADIMYCPATQQFWISWEKASGTRQPRIGRFSRSLSRNWWGTLAGHGKAVSLPDTCRYDGQIMAVWEEWHTIYPHPTAPSIKAQFFW